MSWIIPKKKTPKMMTNDGILTFGSATIADFAECRGDIDAIRYLYDKMTSGQDESYRCRASRRMEVAKEQAGEIIEE